MVEAALEHYETSLPMPRHSGHAIGHPMPGLDSLGLGHRIDELFATGLLMICTWNVQSVARAFERSSGTATIGTWCSDFHLITFLSSVHEGNSPFFY